LLKKHISSHSLHEPEGIPAYLRCAIYHVVFFFLLAEVLSSFNMVIILAALSLYISILEQQAKYDAALEILSGDLGSLMGREEDKLRTQVISISIFFDSVLFFK
jgi:N-terminal acetyltransferase B complex non-catalytic subunit